LSCLPACLPADENQHERLLLVARPRRISLSSNLFRSNTGDGRVKHKAHGKGITIQIQIHQREAGRVLKCWKTDGVMVMVEHFLLSVIVGGSDSL
jgi:hypothetical protein